MEELDDIWMGKHLWLGENWYFYGKIREKLWVSGIRYLWKMRKKL